MRTWHIYHFNCGCASSRIARSYPAHKSWIRGPRCVYCGKVLGWMDWSHEGTIRAGSEFEALEDYGKACRDKQ